MPIAVMCPGCSANFSVKDELAGKRAKCPKCAEPLTIPGGAPAAPVAVAKPVTARAVAVPVKPTDEDDRPKGKKQRDEEDTDEQSRGKKRRDDVDEEDRPKNKRRKDDEDDKPKGKRRRDDDDKPKKSVLPLVLGIVGGVVLLCAGGCGGFYWFVIKPAGEKLQAFGSDLQAEVEKNKQNQEKQRPAEEPPVATLTTTELVNSLTADRKKYDKKWITLSGPVILVNTDTQPGKPDWGYVHLGVGIQYVKCLFKADEWAKLPKFQDGKTYSITGLFDANLLGVSMDWCRLVGESGIADSESRASLSADDFADKGGMYSGKTVTVSGVVKTVNPIGDGSSGGSVFLVTSGGKKDVKITFNAPQWSRQKFKPGDQVQAKGTVLGPFPKMIELSRCDILQHTPGTGGVAPQPAPSGPAISPAQLAQDFDKLKGQVVTVRGKVVNTIEELSRVKGTVVFEVAGGGKLGSWAVLDKGNWRPDFLTAGDTVEVSGKVTGPVGNPGTGQYVELTDAELLKRTTKDGKDVPIPAKIEPKKEDAIVVSANALRDEYLKDPKKADEKYKGKLVQVTGTVMGPLHPAYIRFTDKADGKYTSCFVRATVPNGVPDMVKERGRVTVVGRVKGLDVDDSKKLKMVIVDDCMLTK